MLLSLSTAVRVSGPAAVMCLLALAGCMPPQVSAGPPIMIDEVTYETRYVSGQMGTLESTQHQEVLVDGHWLTCSPDCETAVANGVPAAIAEAPERGGSGDHH